jgi:hypothetical protein
LVQQGCVEPVGA